MSEKPALYANNSKTFDSGRKAIVPAIQSALSLTAPSLPLSPQKAAIDGDVSETAIQGTDLASFALIRPVGRMNRKDLNSLIGQAINHVANMEKPDGKAVVQAVKLMVDFNEVKENVKGNQGAWGDEMARALLRAEVARRVQVIDEPKSPARDV